MSERILTYRQAVAEAMAEEMARDERVFSDGRRCWQAWRRVCRIKRLV